MIIQDVVSKYPEAATVMLKYGLHCVGCGSSGMDTIESGSKIHGMTDEEIDKLVADINETVGQREDRVNSGKLVSLTEIAAKKVKEYMEQENKKDAALRVSVTPGGCAGFQYGLEFDEKTNENDEVFEENGVKIIVDKESVQFLGGTEIDFVDGLNGTGFKVHNPNAEKSCGCGQSFS